MLRPALLLPLVLLAACGPKSDEDTIRGIVREGSAHPEAICTHLTRQALRDLGGAAACRKLARSQDNTDPDVRIESVVVDGDRATAQVTGKDGRQTIRFRKEDGEWRVSPG